MAKTTIICVDDEQIVLTSLKEQLKRSFDNTYSIETAESGEEALEIIKELVEEQTEIPVVISDQIMPGLKGDELLIQLKDLLPNVRSILLTGQAGADAVGNALNHANLYRYIAKPWDAKDLALTVEEAIRSFYQEKKLEEQNVELLELNRTLEDKIHTFHKFVPSQFLQMLNLEDESDYVKLGVSAEKSMTIMFSDIRSFTSISEKLSPEQAFQFINDYLFEMGPVIREHGGFIDKFIGDAIMALFESADDGVRCAVAMIDRLTDYNKRLKKKKLTEIKIGIGLHTGNVMLGTVGEDNRLQTTVIGDAVNLAARVESLTKLYETPLNDHRRNIHRPRRPHYLSYSAGEEMFSPKIDKTSFAIDETMAAAMPCPETSATKMPNRPLGNWIKSKRSPPTKSIGIYLAAIFKPA